MISMSSKFISSAATIILASITIPSVALGTPQDRVGQKLESASLINLQGEPVRLLDMHTGKALVIAYTGVGCPISGRYAPRLQELSDKYGKKGVQFVGVNANLQDNTDLISKEVSQLGITFPVLKDSKQELTRQLDAKTTTEVFVVDKDGVIRYRGMIDDQYAVGLQRSSPKNHYLETAIKDVLAGREVYVSRTAAPGCLITRVKPASGASRLTYSADIARIVQDNCQSCHRPGQVGPFPLTTYEEVSGWSAMIYSVLQNNQMPPWNADASHQGIFVNERAMPPAEKQKLLAWIDDGMPRGNPAEDPPEKEWPKGWRIGKPDKVFTMKTVFRVPAEGVVDYQYFQIPTFNKEDKWIAAMEAKPGAEDVVHHILVFIKDTKSDAIDRRNIGLDDGFLCAAVPGDIPSIFPPGTAKKLPAGATLVFQVHYTTNGKRREDKCSIGMIFTDAPIEREVKTRGYGNFTFEIPPGANNHEVKAEYVFQEDTEILSLYPHMHFRGKDWKFTAHYPDGKEQTLLWVPRYKYDWQESYLFRKPVLLPKGTKLEAIAHFDNSAANFVNPDPSKQVRFGEQSWDEMMVGYFDYVQPTSR